MLWRYKLGRFDLCPKFDILRAISEKVSFLRTTVRLLNVSRTNYMHIFKGLCASEF